MRTYSDAVMAEDIFTTGMGIQKTVPFTRFLSGLIALCGYYQV